MVSRTAVLIGVNKTGGLTTLNAAVSGARAMDAWLTREGFKVDLLDDEQDDVTVDKVKKAVKAQLDGNLDLEQMVIYFAGHGYLNGTAEIWLLSGAPEDPDEAIDQTVSAEFARTCGVPNVVFISDACRSNPPNRMAGMVSGSSIFPNRSSGTDVDVDRFFATRPGDPALEMSADAARKVYFGLFTDALHKLHRDPSFSLVKDLVRGGTTITVVPCRKLKDVIADHVDTLAQTRNIALSQRPQLRLECGDDAFLARAEYSPGFAAPEPTMPPVTSPPLSDGGSLMSLHPFRKPSSAASPKVRPQTDRKQVPSAVDDALRDDPRFKEAARQVVEADAPGQFETRCGAHVTGAMATWAMAISAGADIFHDALRTLVRVSGPDGGELRAATTLVLQFTDGAGTAIAALPGYIASVLVDAGRVVNVSYVPSRGSVRWPLYESVQAQVESLRSIAAAAARNGILAVDRSDAPKFAASLRQLKVMDPTLGIYAAFAYAEVGRRNDIGSILRFMRDDLDVDLFDVVLLADPIKRPDAASVSAYPVVPFCPMLNQNWSFLRARSAVVPPAVTRAGLHRRPALWTTFEPDGLAILRKAVEAGELQ